MKRVLLVSYTFPPEPKPGAQRPAYLARYLPKFGWLPTIITPARARPPFEAEIVNAGYAQSIGTATSRVDILLPRSSRLRALLRPVKDALVFPDEQAGWIPAAIFAGMRVLRANKYDAILTTALPTSTHVIGAALSKISGVPWIADYRDLWSGNPYMPWGPVKKRLEAALERFVIRQASHITTISDPLARHLRALHHRDVSVIENAFDAAEWDAIRDEEPESFDLVYTGTLYGGKRSPAVLFDAVRRLQQRRHPAGSAVRMHFYGSGNETALEQARALGLESQVFLHGVVPRDDALRAQRRSAGLLIFLSVDPQTAQEKGSKYLEYLGAGRRMLVVGPPGSVMRDTVDSLEIGYFASDAEEAEQALSALYARFESGAFRVNPRLQNVQTAEKLVEQFAECLDRACPAVNVRRMTIFSR